MLESDDVVDALSCYWVVFSLVQTLQHDEAVEALWYLLFVPQDACPFGLLCLSCCPLRLTLDLLFASSVGEVRKTKYSKRAS